MSKARFTLGQIVCTPGSLEACRPFSLCPQLYFLELLHRPYRDHGENCLWIITEADRSVTTILLPSEY